MRLTMFTDYTLRVLMFLALARDRLVTIPELATVFDVSPNHLMKVVHQLARSGVIESVRGKGGGVRLGRAPETIRIGQIVRHSEGDAPIVECLASPGRCVIDRACKLKGALAVAIEALYDSLDRHTLADLIANERPLLVALGRRRA